MNARFCTFAMACVIVSPLASAADASKECQVGFSLNSAVVDAKALALCLDVLQLKSGNKVDINAFASPEGTVRHNLKLSKRRAENVKAILVKNVKGLIVNAQGLGVRLPEGRVSIIINNDKAEVAPAVVSKLAEPIPGIKVAALGISDAVATKSASANSTQGNWRAALRSGFDSTRIEERSEYFAPGLDVAYLPELANPYMRLELGALASLYADGSRNRLGSYHFAPMVGYQKSGYIAGLRGLAGTVHSNETDKNFTDTGAELRLGVEKDQWSLFLGAGRSSTLDRVGMDFGVRF